MVTKEMICAAHDICLKKGDFVLSASLLERIYLAMRDKADILDYELSLGCVARLSEQLRTVTKQRDELLAELERFMDSHEECTDFDGFTAQIVSMADYHQAQEAIASSKGEQ